MCSCVQMDVTDQINVIPYVLPAATSNDAPGAQQNRWRGGEFVLFRQRKYGLRGESLAVAGGQVEMAREEAPLAAAQRELAEELFLWGQEGDWVDLGSYRVNVNRGHGTVSCFLVAGARPLADATGAAAEFKVDELERQRVVRLSFEQMEDAVRTHKFAEIKWAATAALALDVIRQRIRDEDARLALGAPALLNEANPAAEAAAGADTTLLSERATEGEEAQANVEAESMAHRREMNLMASQPQQQEQQEQQQQQSTEAATVPLVPSDAVQAEPAAPAAPEVSSVPEQAAAPIPAAESSPPTSTPAVAVAAPQAPLPAPTVTVLTPVENRSAAAGLNLPPVPPKKTKGPRRPGFSLRSKALGRGKRSANPKPKDAAKGKGKGSRGRTVPSGSKYSKGKGKKGSGQK